MNLAEIIAAKKAGGGEAANRLSTALPTASPTALADDDCFLLSGSSSGDSSLRALLHLINRGSSQANLTANDCAGLRVLATWLGPFPSSHLPYCDKVPRLLQSYTMWQLGPIIGMPPAKYWKVLLSVLVEAEAVSSIQKNFA